MKKPVLTEFYDVPKVQLVNVRARATRAISQLQVPNLPYQWHLRLPGLFIPSEKDESSPCGWRQGWTPQANFILR